ncbi:MAG: hypothetical protein G01um101413_539 [Parcubacteria group bacterium Gr01-1014_13]|nr:MAG: hypothetical protein G01um101413_539 [Parcubacteria group bacterium Gr01-1014_13]
MPTIKVKMNDTQFKNAMAIIEAWEKDPKYSGLIEVLDTPDEERHKDIETTLLKVSGGITYDIWNEFCRHLRMKIPFPIN